MNHLDASAAVKLVWREPGFENIRNYFAKESGFFMTSLCLAEALGVLKRKKDRGELSEQNYFDSCWVLLGYLRSPVRIRVDEIELSSLDTFAKAEAIARQYKLDLSDSLQLVSVKHGKFSSWVQESKTLLITADGDLESAARTEGLRVWNCEKEATPPAQ
jgi:predicted nucleic acid-binding protein